LPTKCKKSDRKDEILPPLKKSSAGIFGLKGKRRLEVDLAQAVQERELLCVEGNQRWGYGMKERITQAKIATPHPDAATRVQTKAAETLRNPRKYQASQRRDRCWNHSVDYSVERMH